MTDIRKDRRPKVRSDAEVGNLVRKMKEGDRLQIGPDVVLELVKIKGRTQIVINVEAPRELKIVPLQNERDLCDKCGWTHDACLCARLGQ